MVEDAALLERWRAGDLHAGNELFARHFDAVVRVFRYKADDELQDLVQRTFLACLEHPDRPAACDRFRPYLLGVARNQLLRYFEQRAGPRGRIDALRTSMHELESSPTGKHQHLQTMSILAQALRRIPLEYQLVLELYYWEELSGLDLAQLLDVPEGTARSRLRLAKQRLREQVDALEGRGASLDDDALERRLRDELGGG